MTSDPLIHEGPEILISPRYGSGWSTWFHENRKAKYFALKYKPLIEYLKNYPEDADEYANDTEEFGKLVEEFKAEYEKRFGSEIYTGGSSTLTVVTVSGAYYIHENDGAESVRFFSHEPSNIWVEE